MKRKESIPIAHSKDDKYNVSEQPYGLHVKGVVSGCLRSLNRIEKFVSKVNYDILRNSVILAAIYHDLGKLDKQPQSVLKGKKKAKMLNHVDAGVALLLGKYLETKNSVYLIAAYLVLGHHIGFPNFDRVIDSKRDMLKIILYPKSAFRDGKSCKKYSMGKKKVYEHVNTNLSKYIALHQKHCDITESVSLEGIREVDVQAFMRSPMSLRVALSILVDADHEDTSLNYKQPYPHRQLDLEAAKKRENLEKYIGEIEAVAENNKNISKERLGLRKEFFDNTQKALLNGNFFLLDGVVGIGKTFSLMMIALRLSEKYNLDTINFVLPYISLIDQSASEYDHILTQSNRKKFELNVIHSVFREPNLFLRKYQKGFNAPINLTTSVNFFEILTSNCTSFLRNIHKIVGSVICMDEYHTIAPYEMWPVMLMIMQDLAKNFSCKFVFSSGTPERIWDIETICQNSKIDNLKVSEIVPDDLYKKMIDMENSRVKITKSFTEEWSFQKLSDEINGHNKSTFVIFGTRKKAFAFVNHYRKNNTRKIFLRYSALSPKHRKIQLEKIKESLKKGESVIVVSTPGADVGLDISFQCGFREPGPYSSILQMIGRINRGCEYPDAFLHIFKLSKDPLGDGTEFHDNPALKFKTDVFLNNPNLHNEISPEYCTDVANKEILAMSDRSKGEMRDLAKMWQTRDFDSISENFSLINMPMLRIVVDEEIGRKILNDEYVPYAEVQENIINLIYSAKNVDLIKDRCIVVGEDEDEDEDSEDENSDDKDKKKNYYNGLYIWKGMYDSENYGILIDPVFGLSDPLIV